MTSKERERLLRLMMPAMLVLIVYAVFFNWPNQRSYKARRDEVDRARRIAVTDQQAWDANQLVIRTQQQLDEKQDQLATGKLELTTMCRSACDPHTRFDTVDQITSLFGRNDVSLISQAVVNQPELSEQLTQVLKKIEKRSGETKLEFRRFSLQGNYTNVVRLVTQLTGEVESALPVSIELDSTDSKDGSHAWNLIVVM